MLEFFIYVIIWGLLGFFTGLVFPDDPNEPNKGATFGDIVTSIIFGPILTYALIVLWIGLNVDIEETPWPVKIVYMIFYLPLHLLAWAETTMNSFLIKIFGEKLFNKEIL